MIPLPCSSKKFADPKTEYVHTDCSLEELAEKWAGVDGCSLGNLTRRCGEENWVERREQFKSKVDARTEEKAVESIAEMKARHALGYYNKQIKAEIWFEELGFKTAKEAFDVYNEAVKGESNARGEGVSSGLPVLKVILSKEDKPEDDGTADQ